MRAAAPGEFGCGVLQMAFDWLATVTRQRFDNLMLRRGGRNSLNVKASLNCTRLGLSGKHRGRRVREVALRRSSFVSLPVI